jgi:CelD/BcsL family acetyltransferase involved in cellulose biosynthesis
MTVSVVRDAEEFRALQVEWNRILAESAWAGPHLTWEWLFTWWEVYGDKGRELNILIERDATGAVQGIAPCIVSRRRRLGVWPIRVLELLGTGEDEVDEVCSTSLGFVVRRGDRATARELLLCLYDGLARGSWDEVRLTRLDPRFRAELDTLGIAPHEPCLCQTRTLSCATIALPEKWEDYVGSLGKSWRKQINRGRKNLAQHGFVSFTLWNQPDEVDKGLDLFVSMHQDKWASEGGRGLFSSSKFARFHHSLLPRFARHGWVGFFVLKADERPIASSYLYLYDETMYCYLGAYDRSFDASLSLGTLERTYRIESAIQRACKGVDFRGVSLTSSEHCRDSSSGSGVCHRGCGLAPRPAWVGVPVRAARELATSVRKLAEGRLRLRHLCRLPSGHRASGRRSRDESPARKEGWT